MTLEHAHENVPGTLTPALAETMTLIELEHALEQTHGKKVSMDSRNWQSNTANIAIVQTTDGYIAQYALEDGMYDFKPFARVGTPMDADTQMMVETAILTATQKHEVGPACLKWALTLPLPEQHTLRARIAALIDDFGNRLNITAKPEKADLSIAA